MDATARRWSNRRHTVVALIALAFISFLVLHDSDDHSFIHHDRRHIQLVVREGKPTPATAAAGASTTPASSSLSFASSAVSSSSSALSSSVEFTTISSTTQSSFSSFSSSASVAVIPTSSTVSSSSSSQSAQTSPSSSISSQTQSPSSGTATSILPSQSTERSPATTLAITGNEPPALVTGYSSSTQPPLSNLTTPTSTPISAAVNSSSFWQKKGAVAATFLIVALVILAISAILVITFFKRRSAHREAQLHDELFEKYSEPDHRGSSPGPSITSTPMDAFASREVRYDSSPSFQNYATPNTQRAVHSSSPVQHPDYYNQPPSRYLAPSQTQAARSAAPPTAFRNPDNRDSYQHSIDSFYGAAGQPSDYSS